MDAIVTLAVDWPLAGLWGNAIGMIVVFVSLMACIGFAGRSMAVGSVGAYLMFAFYATEMNNAALENLLYVTMVLIIVGMSMKVWRLEGFETGS